MDHLFLLCSILTECTKPGCWEFPGPPLRKAAKPVGLSLYLDQAAPFQAPHNVVIVGVDLLRGRPFRKASEHEKLVIRQRDREGRESIE
jgi:hypothetical protein